MAPLRISTTEYAVLGLLSEQPSHGFAISRQLGPEGEVGRVLTVRRPLVYRALDRLVEIGCAEPVSTEKGSSGPQRVIYRITPTGRRRLRRWLGEPVEHVRQLRIEFLLKLALLQRSKRSAVDLIRDQRAMLEPTIRALDEGAIDGEDPVEMWRRHNATAAGAYLEDLEGLYDRRRESQFDIPRRPSKPSRTMSSPNSNSV
jgi:DNA-binding PadR family transcriptional regulator